MALQGKWFTELCTEGGSAFSLQVRDKIHTEQTPYQLLEIYDTERFGKLMTLDGLIMLSQRDNFIYHEMMTHPALFSHPDPKRVLIIGGGDCGSLHEVLKHDSIESVAQVELDERVTRVAEQYFPELCQSNSDPRAHFYFTDGIQWLAQAEANSYDVIIIDSTDPVGPAAGLFGEAFYRSCFNALCPNGLLIAQSESPLYHLDILLSMRNNMAGAGFSRVTTLQFPQCVYPSGWWSATMAQKTDSAAGFRTQAIESKKFATRFYNAEIHISSCALPEFLRQAFQIP